MAYFNTGSTNINVFSNVPQLIQGVVALDSNLNNTINTNISNSRVSDPIALFDTTNVGNPFYFSTKQLLYGMLHIANDVRREMFYKDLTLQHNTNNIYWVRFHKGDIMSVLIKYISNYGIRSYKIALLCGSSFLFPPYVGYNSLGNLNPFYILSLLNIAFDENFVLNFNQTAPNMIPDIYKQIGYIINPIDFYFKTFMSNISQPSIINDDLMNNGLNPSFQYIFLNSTITTILYPSLRTIKASLINSPYNQYPTLNDIQDIQCDLNSYDSDQFIIRIYTRPYFSIDNTLTMDNFYGNYFDSYVSGTFDYTTFHLNDLFSNWTTILNTYQPRTVYYNSGSTTITTYGEEEILAICIYTNVANANIGIKNIIVSYK